MCVQAVICLQPSTLSVGGGIPFCKVIQKMDCEWCYGNLTLMKPLRFEAGIRKEAMEKVEELSAMGKPFVENCMGKRARCLTVEQSEGVYLGCVCVCVCVGGGVWVSRRVCLGVCIWGGVSGCVWVCGCVSGCVCLGGCVWMCVGGGVGMEMGLC